MVKSLTPQLELRQCMVDVFKRSASVVCIKRHLSLILLVLLIILISFSFLLVLLNRQTERYLPSQGSVETSDLVNQLHVEKSAERHLPSQGPTVASDHANIQHVFIHISYSYCVDLTERHLPSQGPTVASDLANLQ